MATDITTSLPVGNQTAAFEEQIYDDGYLRIEYDNYYIACGGNQLSLPRKEFLIVSRLARKAERIVTSEEIWRYAWGNSAQFNAKSLRVHIHRLRNILTPLGLRIESMVGVGYRLSASQVNDNREIAE
jgi:DNA-binding response OmpR family regulator